MHAVWLARNSRRRGDRALEPEHLLGAGHAPDRHAARIVRAFYRPIAELEALTSRLSSRAGGGGSALLEHEGVCGDHFLPAPPADMRYVGQEYSSVFDDQ